MWYACRQVGDVIGGCTRLPESSAETAVTKHEQKAKPKMLPLHSKTKPSEPPVVLTPKPGPLPGLFTCMSKTPCPPKARPKVCDREPTQQTSSSTGETNVPKEPAEETLWASMGVPKPPVWSGPPPKPWFPAKPRPPLKKKETIEGVGLMCFMHVWDAHISWCRSGKRTLEAEAIWRMKVGNVFVYACGLFLQLAVFICTFLEATVESDLGGCLNFMDHRLWLSTVQGKMMHACWMFSHVHACSIIYLQLHSRPMFFCDLFPCTMIIYCLCVEGTSPWAGLWMLWVQVPPLQAQSFESMLYVSHSFCHWCHALLLAQTTWKQTCTASAWFFSSGLAAKISKMVFWERGSVVPSLIHCGAPKAGNLGFIMHALQVTSESPKG